MSRIYKKLIEEDQESLAFTVPERPQLHLVPPPPSARMLAPFFTKNKKKKHLYTHFALVLMLSYGAYYAYGLFFHNPPGATVVESTPLIVEPEKGATAIKPILPLSADLVKHQEALELFKKQDYAGAKLRFEKLLDHYPDSVELLNDLGLSYAKLGEPALAKKYFTKAYKLSPNSGLTLNNLGSLALAQKDLPQSILLFTHALKSQPDLVESRLNLAFALESSGNVQGAIREYELYLVSPRASPELKPMLSERLDKIKAFWSVHAKDIAQYSDD